MFFKFRPQFSNHLCREIYKIYFPIWKVSLHNTIATSLLSRQRAPHLPQRRAPSQRLWRLAWDRRINGLMAPRWNDVQKYPKIASPPCLHPVFRVPWHLAPTPASRASYFSLDICSLYIKCVVAVVCNIALASYLYGLNGLKFPHKRLQYVNKVKKLTGSLS